DRGVRSSIDDYVRTHSLQRRFNSLVIQHIQLIATERHHFYIGRIRLRERAPDLTVRSSNQHFHGYHSADTSGTPAASRAASTGSTPVGRGHSIPSSGSFHKSTRSLAGS